MLFGPSFGAGLHPLPLFPSLLPPPFPSSFFSLPRADQMTFLLALLLCVVEVG